MSLSSVIAIPFGDLNWPLSFPGVPHAKTKFPSESNFWTLFNLLSTTNILPSATAIPDGFENSPG